MSMYVHVRICTYACMHVCVCMYINVILCYYIFYTYVISWLLIKWTENKGGMLIFICKIYVRTFCMDLFMHSRVSILN